MKIKFILTMTCMLVGFAIQSQKQLPEIIDREIFFGDPEIAGGKLSPNGKWMSFIKPYKGNRNIWIKAVGDPFEKAKPITADVNRPISQYFWSRDSKFILYAQDKGGNENYHVYAVNPFQKLTDGKNVPDARDLTPKENIVAQIYAVPKSNPDLMYIGLNDRDASWHDLYELRISTGELKLLRENTDRMISWHFDTKDKMRLGVRANDDGSSELFRLDKTGMTSIYKAGILESFNVLQFHPDGSRIYLETNVGQDKNLTQLELFHIQSLKTELVESDPKKRADFGSANFSEIDHKLLYTAYEDDKVVYYFKDKKLEDDYKLITKQLKGKQVSFTSSTSDERVWLLAAYSDVDPGAVYLFNRNSKQLTFQYRPRPKMPIDNLSPMKVVRFKSSDKLEIPGYLTIPKGSSGKKLPLIVNPHGGPWARDSWGYNPYAQFLANRGYAVLNINFRGSTGFGKKFIDAGNKEWGQLMQDDITYGIKFLIKKGIVDPNRVGILGGSYGGYAVLAGLTFTPDLYACGVDIVGPSNLLTLLKTIPPYWEAGRKIFHTRMGDPTTEAGEALLKKQSPLFSVENIRVPLMVVQGANDPRVKKAESDQIVNAMVAANLPVEYICALDEGHGFSRPINNMAFLAAAEKFLATHLGGRYQSSMPADVEAKLKEITVDVKSISTPTTIETSQTAIASKELKPGKYIYGVKLAIMGQQMDLDQTIQVQDNGSNWGVKEVMTMPQGEVVDEGTLNKPNLQIQSRKTDQGPMELNIVYGANNITGEINLLGNKTPINVSTTEPCFADGPAALLCIAALPLEKGYTASFNNFDMQELSLRSFALLVEDVESISTIDGDHTCYRVIFRPANGDPGGMTVWVDTNDRTVYKYFAKLPPSMGGGTMTGELISKEEK